MKKQILSFRNAFRGIVKTINSEGHMRFHLVAGFYVMLFSLFYDFSSLQYSVLVILIAMMLSLEILNTSIEEIANLCADRYEPLVRKAKDCAAGAVLVLAISAVAVGLFFFWDFSTIAKIFDFFAGNIPLLVLLVLSVVLAVVFVAYGPTGIKERCFLHRHKNKTN